VQVKATGEAAIYGGDKSQARDRALSDAMRKAVEQAVGTVVSSETITQNFELISDKIFSKSKGYVRKYKILSEKSAEGVVRVKIEAVVSTADLSSDLDGILAVLRAKDMPRILVMVSEQNVGQGGPSFWWKGGGFSMSLDAVENAFMEAWLPKGFKFVDRQALSGHVSAGPALTVAAPGAAAVKEFAVKTGADVVVVGQAVANDVGTIMGSQLHSIRGNCSVRVFNLDSGEVIATSTQTAVAGHIDPTTGGTQALSKVAKKVAKDLLGKILQHWKSEIASGTTVNVTISNVKKSRYLRDLREFLKSEIRGVSAVRQRSYRKKVAMFEVDISAKPEDLATELEEKKFPGFSIEIDEITANTVSASLK